MNTARKRNDVEYSNRVSLIASASDSIRSPSIVLQRAHRRPHPAGGRFLRRRQSATGSANLTWSGSQHTEYRRVTHMRRFDSTALYHAMDQKRHDRGMTWADISKEIHASVSTIRRTTEGGRMEVDGMIAMVDWLGVPVETFVRETTDP